MVLGLGKLKVKYIVYVVCAALILWLIVHFSGGDHLGEGELISETCWVPKGRRYCAPQFIIAGAMKSGTTSLWTYLLNHPDVLPLVSVQIDPKKLRTVLAEKEVRFFNDPAYPQLVREYGKQEAVDYYLDLFAQIPPERREKEDPFIRANHGKITGEASPMYINSLGTAQRIREALPHVKILIVLRNPIDRAYSDYWFRKSLKIRTEIDQQSLVNQKRSHDEIFSLCIDNELDMADHCRLNDWLKDPTFQGAQQFHKCMKNLSDKVLAATPASEMCSGELAQLCLPDDVRRNCQSKGLLYSLYAYQLFEWLYTFPKDNLMIRSSEYLFERPNEFMLEVQQFLHLDPFDWSSVTDKAFNIVNPDSLTGKNLELVTNNMSGNKKLQVGLSPETADYPPLDPSVRARLLARLEPHNRFLSELLQDPSFLLWNKN